MDQPADVAILGGGPAGVTAAYLLARQGRSVVLLEAGAGVGGLARTEVRDGFRFDLGGHRFFTKSREVEALWHEILGDELLVRRRQSRIRYRGRYLDYPLRAGDVVRKLGPAELARALASYARAATRPGQPQDTFEQWVTRRFGRRLYEMFFASYTEKVWGVPGRELSAEWAAQRIQGLSFAAAARAALRGRPDGSVRSLIDRFHYPRLGPGQMWEAMADRIVSLGGEVRTSTPVERLELEDGAVSAVVGGGVRVRPQRVISSLPLATVPLLARPAPRPEVLAAARGLRHRDFLTVALVLRGRDPFPDNWLYIHDPDVRVARIQNYRAWSPALVPRPDRACLGLEYFCFAGDELWSTSDEDLVARAGEELERLGLARGQDVERGYVVRVPQAYPIYDPGYQPHVARIRGWLEGLANLQQIGRNGLHRYNNSDHSMLTAIRAVQNLDGAAHDVWSVNLESWYHETEVPEESPYLRAPALRTADA